MVLVRQAKFDLNRDGENSININFNKNLDNTLLLNKSNVTCGGWSNGIGTAWR